MGLPPLEYIDCFLDSPSFREMLSQYERELEENSAYVKQLVKECKRMILATEEFSKVQRSFAQTLGSFRFQTIGEQTEDEKMIVNSLQTFAKLLFSIEDCRHNMLTTISVRLLQTLEHFRKEQIQKTKEEKRKFDRLTGSYYKTLDSNLSTSSKKKEAVLNEVDSSLAKDHLGFLQCAFDYVCKLQDVHAQKQYELIEPIIGYISDVSTFLHQAHDGAVTLKPELNAMQFKVQILRERHLEEQERAYELKAQVISEGEAGLVHHPIYLRQGHLLVQDNKRVGGLGLGWHRYFCQFKKQEQGAKGKVKMMRFIPVGHHGLLPSSDFMEVKNVFRSRSDDVDRRFCFECDLYTLKGESRKYIMQASTSEDRKSWLEIMEGREPIFASLKVMEVSSFTPQGFVFVRKCIEVIEARGLDEEGLYRKPGILSKATRLVKDALERGKVDSIDLTDEFEWDTKTLASAVKNYFSKHLGAPLLTFDLHERFIEAAKTPSLSQRVEGITVLVKELPEANRKMLYILMEHLNKIAVNSYKNLMKASNIGVVFGPLLMRPERESVATILDIKYQSIIVELMVEQMEKIFCGLDVMTDQPVSPMSKIGGVALSHKVEGDGRPPKRPSRRAPPMPPPIPRINHEAVPASPRAVHPSAIDHRIPRSDSAPMRARPVGQREKSPPDPPPAEDKPQRDVSLGKNARALYDCDAEDDLELSFSRDDILYDINSSKEPEWVVATRSDGRSGLVPSNYIEFLPSTTQQQMVSSGELGLVQSLQNKDSVLEHGQGLARVAEESHAPEAPQAQQNQSIKDMKDLLLQAFETERNLQSQLDEKSRHYKNELEMLQGEVEQLRSQLSSREIDFWTVPRCNVNLDSEIGIGGWGIISKGTFHGRAVAVKQLHLEIVSEDNISRLRREVRLMAHVRHPNILLFIAAVFDDRVDRLHPPMIVMELLDIDLRKAYETNTIGQHNLTPIFQDVACALNYLHSLREPIIHRDLSAPNVLLEALANNRWKAKLSDFGSANYAKLAQTAAEGAILYLAPECLPEDLRPPNAPNFPQTPKIDVYSFGVLICEVITRSLPTQRRQMMVELKSKWPFVHGLADACMKYNPNDRPTMLHLLNELVKTA